MEQLSKILDQINGEPLSPNSSFSTHDIIAALKSEEDLPSELNNLLDILKNEKNQEVTVRDLIETISNTMEITEYKSGEKEDLFLRFFNGESKQTKTPNQIVDELIEKFKTDEGIQTVVFSVTKLMDKLDMGEDISELLIISSDGSVKNVEDIYRMF